MTDMTPTRPARSAHAVFDDHLRRALARDTEGDIAANYAPDVVLLTGVGVFHGHQGVRESRAVLARDLPNGRLEYLTRYTEREYAFVEWRGEAEDVRIEDGADGFLIADGLIRAQWIHYTVMHRTGYSRRPEHDGSRPQ